MNQSIPLETYKIPKKEFGLAVEKVTSLIDYFFSHVDKRIEQIALQKKLETKMNRAKNWLQKQILA